MKKIKTTLLLALCSIALTGCNEPTVNAQAHQRVVNSQPQNDFRMNRIYFDGHYYVKYEIGWKFPAASITHDPDCPCHKEDVNEP